MFARFRQTGRRIFVSVVTTSRGGGKVRHEHIGSLGPLPIAPTTADRIAFWAKLHQRLAALSNRVDPAQAGAIIAAVYARVPMPTPDEQQAVHLDHAREDAEQWAMLADMATEQADGHQQLAKLVQDKAAALGQAAVDTTAHAEAARRRLAKVEAGEAAPARPMTSDELRKAIGVTAAQMRRAIEIHEIDKAGGFEQLLDDIQRRSRRAEDRAVHDLHRRIYGRQRPRD
jgi:hypothetical protein